ncbi:MAG TPA: DUF4382 domain-containing protein [Povalibacter sp.]
MTTAFPRLIASIPVYALAGIGLLLAGCNGAVTVDLAADAPADTTVSNVVVDVAGVEFRRSDGTTEKLEFTQAERKDLLDNSAFRMFTNETLGEGTYTGVRLLLEDNDANRVTRVDGRQFPLNIAEGEYAEVDLTVVKDESSHDDLALSLDLRKSLSFNDDNDEYTLTPALRSTPADKAAQISGNVDIRCSAGSSLAQGGAVYLFTGADIEPNDIGSAVVPYATAAVIADQFSGFSTYSLRYLTPGDYTIAVTCNGDEDEASVDNDIDFVGTANVSVDDSETLTRNLSN